jgi:predicted nucleic acid-binding Zn ribbon protein
MAKKRGDETDIAPAETCPACTAAVDAQAESCTQCGAALAYYRKQQKDSASE